jgi:hypothetical protein
MTIRKSTPTIIIPAREVREGMIMVDRSGNPRDVDNRIRTILRNAPDAPVMVFDAK